MRKSPSWLPGTGALLCAAVAMALTLTLTARPALADVKSGDAKLLRGQYQEAIKDYRAAAAKGREVPRAQVQLGYALVRIGDFAGAERAARAAIKTSDKAAAADGTVLLGEIQRHTGRYGEARATLEAQVKADPTHKRARVVLGQVYLDIGEAALAAQIFQTFYDDWANDKIDQKDARQLFYVAMAARFSEGYQDANETFRDAVTLDPNLLEANIEWGFLFLEKYSAGFAEQSFDEVLKVDANHPDSLVGMAQVKLEQSYDMQAALELIGKALAQNPRHARALLVRAGMEIDNSRYDEAKKTLALVFEVNPNHGEARALLATIAWLGDDFSTYEAERKKAFAQNPRFAQFFHIVADFAVKEHRYREAIQLEGEALKIDPKYADALSAIGSGYLRLGDEQKGLEYLNQAWERDKFNVRTYNMLTLFDETIPKDYVFTSSKYFKFRFHRDEQAILARYVPKLMEQAFADMVKRYGFTPAVPTIIEMFADADAYSVRTVGLPNLGALGVCFGTVITALSPSVGHVNWGMVLWHELGHVFAIQLSNSRVPRWFTEGLSEYETILARKEWRRENDVDVWMAMESGTLPSVVELNGRFLHARDMGDMVVAYHMSSMTIEFIGQKYGFPKIVEGLKLYGKGKGDAEVVKAMTGLDVPAFDAEFRKYLAQRLAPYKGTFKVRVATYDDLTAFEKAAAAKPNDAGVLAELAVAQLGAGELDKAAMTAQKALAIDPRQRHALWVLAELAVAKGDRAGAKQRTEALIAAGGDGFDARLRLGMLATATNDLTEAAAQLGKAKQLDPQRPEPYAVLAEAYDKAGRTDDALRELEGLAQIDEMDDGPLGRLVDWYAGKNEWAKVKLWAERRVEVNPYDADLFVTLGRAQVELRQWDAAIYAFDSALVLKPRRPAVAHVGRARALAGKKDLKGARKAVDEALKLEPKHAEALELKKTLK